MPIGGLSKKQTNGSYSTPEAEFVAGHFGLRALGVPGLVMWERIKKRRQKENSKPPLVGGEGEPKTPPFAGGAGKKLSPLAGDGGTGDELKHMLVETGLQDALVGKEPSSKAINIRLRREQSKTAKKTKPRRG